MDEKCFLRVGAYKVGQDGTLYRIEEKADKDKNGYEVTATIANHSPIVKRLKRLDNGTEISESIEVAVRRAGKEYLFQITTDQIYSPNPNKAFGAANMIFNGRGYVNCYREFIQTQCADMPEHIVYQHTGIQVIDGKRVFLNGGYSVTAEGLTDEYSVELEGPMNKYGFFNKKTEDRYTVFKQLAKLAPLSVILPSVVYCFQTALNPLYRSAGIEPCFTLYIMGRTQSHKTCLAKLLLNFFGHYDYSTPSPAVFQDTVNSLEKKFAVADGLVVVIDDKMPPTTIYQKNHTAEVLQFSLRSIGDKAGKGRMYADGRLRPTYKPKSGCIMTAEDSLDDVSESGIARAFTVELHSSDIDLNILTFMQKHADRLNQIMSEFIQYVLIRWDDLQAKVYDAFSKLRLQAQSKNYGRLGDAVSHLQLSLTILCEWLMSIHQMTEQEASSLKKEAWELFSSLAQDQNKRVTEDKPSRLYLNAIQQLLEIGAARVVDVNTFDSLIDGKIGYVDDEKGFYYLIPDAAYNAVCRFYREQDKRFPLSKNRIHEHLVDEGYVERGTTQITKNVRIFGKQGQRLCLYKSALDQREEVVT